MLLPCSPCCGCGVADGKPRTDPAIEGTWVPSGTWPAVTWTFVPYPSNGGGVTWFFYGSAATSKPGGGASIAEQRDWGNLCNWYSNKVYSPSTLGTYAGMLNKRATRLPDTGAVIHVYSPLTTLYYGAQTVLNAYFWDSSYLTASTLTTTNPAHDSNFGAVFEDSTNCEPTTSTTTLNGGALFLDSANLGTYGIVNGGAEFQSSSYNFGTVNGGAEFRDYSQNRRTINNGASFYDYTLNYNGGTVNGSALFYNSSDNYGKCNDNATFNNSSTNDSSGGQGFVYDGAIFNDNTYNKGYVYNGAQFFGSSVNAAIVNGGAEFNDTSINASNGRVNNGATFNDASCSQYKIGIAGPPCSLKFVAHATDLPVCNGTAPAGCDVPTPSCGCG